MSSQLNRSLQEPANNVELFAEECDMKIDVNRDEVMQVSRRRMVSMSINCRCHTIHTVKQRVCKLWYLRGGTKGKGYNKNSSIAVGPTLVMQQADLYRILMRE